MRIVLITIIVIMDVLSGRNRNESFTLLLLHIIINAAHFYNKLMNEH